jgi:transcriptional regulator with XRE-family HTH domain
MISHTMTQGITTLIRESARRLRSARSAKGLTLSQLSERTGGLLSKSRISNYEQGIRRISVEAARDLSEAFGDVTAAYLLCIDESMAFAADEIDLIRSYRAADAEGRASMRQQASDAASRAAKAR